jgi:hypothetical protein
MVVGGEAGPAGVASVMSVLGSMYENSGEVWLRWTGQVCIPETGGRDWDSLEGIEELMRRGLVEPIERERVGWRGWRLTREGERVGGDESEAARRLWR